MAIRLRAQNAALLETLRKIADEGDPWAANIARAAIAQQEGETK